MKFFSHAAAYFNPYRRPLWVIYALFSLYKKKKKILKSCTAYFNPYRRTHTSLVYYVGM